MSFNTVEYANQLLAENERLKQQVKQLAEENTAMNEAIEAHKRGFVLCEWCGDENTSHSDDVCRVLDETPATDAWLNEVREQSLLAASDELKALAKRSEDGAAEHIHAAALFVQVIASQLRAGEVSNG